MKKYQERIIKKNSFPLIVFGVLFILIMMTLQYIISNWEERIILKSVINAGFILNYKPKENYWNIL